jgi:PAS domain S-box-containing protein
MQNKLSHVSDITSDTHKNIYSFLDDANDLIQSVSPDGLILYANKKWLETLGYVKEELRTLHLIDILREDQVPHCFSLMEKIKQGEDLEFVETTFKSKDGRDIQVEGNISGHFEHGIFIETRGIFRNISDRKANEETFSSLIQNIPTPIYIFQNNKLVYTNPSYCSLTGFTNDELSNKNLLFDLVHPEDKLLVQNNLKRILNTNKSTSYDYRLIRKNGEVRWLSVTNIPILFKNEASRLVRSIDYTERVLSEQALLESKNRYQTLFELSQDAIISLDANGIIASANPSANRIFGYANQELVGKSILDTYVPEQRPNLTDLNYKHDHESAKRFERLAIRKDGFRFSVEVSFSPMHKGCVQEIIHDISGRKSDHDKIVESEKFNSMLLNNSPNPILVINPDTSIKYVNPAFTELTQFSIDEVIGCKAPYPWYPADKITEYLQEIPIFHTTGKHSAERRFLKKNSQILWVKVSSTTPDSNGETGFNIVNWDDITEMKIAEEALRVSEANFKHFINNAPLGISLTLVEGKVLDANKAMLNLYGCVSKQEFKSIPISERYADPSDRTNFLEQLNTEGFVKGMIALMKKQDCSEFWASISAIYQKHGSENCIVTIVEDVTIRKKAKEELEKANQKLIELDKLKDNILSTVSHELRTPLTSIKSFAEILLNCEESRETQKEFLGIINDESDRLTRLINDFLDLAKIQEGRMSWKTVELELKEIITAAANSLKPLVDKNNLEFTVTLTDNFPKIIGDRDKLIQVFTNLIGNAIKFTPEGGKISLTAQLAKKSTEPNSSIMAQIAIRDTGIGIAPEHYDKIFEKFGQVGDVLKDRPKGTGLGLPISKKIIENYGGNIWVESKPGEGSTFYFTLPVS